MTTDFVATENVDHFVALLQDPRLEPETQKTLQKLLVEEENKLARNREQLELAERRVHEGRERIRKMKSLLPRSRFALRDLGVIETMEEVQELLESFHRQLRDEIFPFRVMLGPTVVSTCCTIDEARVRGQHFANANRGVDVMILDRANGDSHVIKPE